MGLHLDRNSAMITTRSKIQTKDHFHHRNGVKYLPSRVHILYKATNLVTVRCRVCQGGI